MGETVGVGAAAGPGAAAGAEKGVVAVGTGPTVDAAGPEGKKTSWDGDAKEGADVAGTAVGASEVGKSRRLNPKRRAAYYRSFRRRPAPPWPLFRTSDKTYAFPS